MKRLTSKRNWEETKGDLKHEMGYSHIWKRLAEIETILGDDGDDYNLDRLKELVQADREERCVVHPLKSDDEVYIILLSRVFLFEVTSAVWYRESPIYKAMHGIHLCYVFNQDDIGKTVFLTREEAEAALKTMNERNK